ncbi:gp436 family protein [Azonexus sp.]|uniref:gp436 family protein n=1 Tax=Azonexus sp. TaxID=1872668 RepID=UPI0035AE228F
MAYLSASDLLTRFGTEELAQVADRGTPRQVTAEQLRAAITSDPAGWSAAERDAMAVINSAIADACSAIDGYLGGRYSTPLPSAPTVVTRLAGDLARYFLYDDHATETVQKRYDAAMAFLRDVAAGKVSLGAEADTPATSVGTVQVVTGGRIFGRGQRGL